MTGDSLWNALEVLWANMPHHDTCATQLSPEAGYDCSCSRGDIADLLATYPPQCGESETDDGAGTPPAAVAAAGETATPAPSSPTLGLDRDAVADRLLAIWHERSAKRIEASAEEHCRAMADAVVALARPENEVKAEAWADAVLAIRAEYPTDDQPDAATEAYGDGLSDAVTVIDRLQKSLRSGAVS